MPYQSVESKSNDAQSISSGPGRYCWLVGTDKWSIMAYVRGVFVAEVGGVRVRVRGFVFAWLSLAAWQTELSPFGLASCCRASRLAPSTSQPLSSTHHRSRIELMPVLLRSSLHLMDHGLLNTAYVAST